MMNVTATTSGSRSASTGPSSSLTKPTTDQSASARSTLAPSQDDSLSSDDVVHANRVQHHGFTSESEQVLTYLSVVWHAGTLGLACFNTETSYVYMMMDTAETEDFQLLRQAVTADSGTPTAGTPSREDSRQRSPAVMKFSDDSSKVVGRQLSGSPRQLKVRIENSRQREVRVQFVTEHLKCSPRHPEAPVKLCIAQCALNKFLPKGRGFLNVSPDPPVDRITTFCQSNGSGEVSRARRVSNISRYLNRLLRAPLARRLILDKTRVTNIKKNI
ncbi:MutS protein msh5 [Branchiostoma belcheri]|nr:MutS protein msh5 [Branchiostoma belcheri]